MADFLQLQGGTRSQTPRVNTEVLSDTGPNSGGLTVKDSVWNIRRRVVEITSAVTFLPPASGSVPSAEHLTTLRFHHKR